VDRRSRNESTTIAVAWRQSGVEVAISEEPGQVHERHRFSRERFQRWLASDRRNDRDGGVRSAPSLGPTRSRVWDLWCSCRPMSSDPTYFATRPDRATAKACSKHFGTRTFGRCQSSRSRSKHWVRCIGLSRHPGSRTSHRASQYGTGLIEEFGGPDSHGRSPLVPRTCRYFWRTPTRAVPGLLRSDAEPSRRGDRDIEAG